MIFLVTWMRREVRRSLVTRFETCREHQKVSFSNLSTCRGARVRQGNFGLRAGESPERKKLSVVDAEASSH